MTVPPEIRLRNVIDVMTKPAWAWSVLRGKRKNFGNLAGHVRGTEDINSLSQWIAGQFDPSLNWKDVEWIRSIWPGKLILKGILDVEDARLATKTGAALVVSNHGGRQLDGAPSSISALPRIVDAVGGDIEVMFDGGIRTGQDVLRALALGARSCMIGRAYIYGLGAAGRPVSRRRSTSSPGAGRHHGADRHAPRRRHRPARARPVLMKIPGPDHPITIAPHAGRVRVSSTARSLPIPAARWCWRKPVILRSSTFRARTRR